MGMKLQVVLAGAMFVVSGGVLVALGLDGFLSCGGDVSITCYSGSLDMWRALTILGGAMLFAGIIVMIVGAVATKAHTLP